MAITLHYDLQLEPQQCQIYAYFLLVCNLASHYVQMFEGMVDMHFLPSH